MPVPLRAIRLNQSLSHKQPHKVQLFLTPLWRRANARNVSLATLYGGWFTWSTLLIILSYLVILSHRRSITGSFPPVFNSIWLELFPFYLAVSNQPILKERNPTLTHSDQCIGGHILSFIFNQMCNAISGSGRGQWWWKILNDTKKKPSS